MQASVEYLSTLLGHHISSEEEFITVTQEDIDRELAECKRKIEEEERLCPKTISKARLESLRSNYLRVKKRQLEKLSNNIMARGKLILVQGPMFSGKTDYAISTVNKIARCSTKNKSVTGVRFSIDDRYGGDTSIQSHSGNTLRHSTDENVNIGIYTLDQFILTTFKDADIIYIEELHLPIRAEAYLLSKDKTIKSVEECESFFTDKVYDMIHNLLLIQKKTIIVTLNDYWNTLEPVKIATSLARLAKKVKHLRSNCRRCEAKNGATLSVKLRDVTLAETDDAGIIESVLQSDKKSDQEPDVGGAEKWMALCPQCHYELFDEIQNMY